MNRRTFATLAVIAAVLAAIAALTQGGRDSGSIAGASAGEPILPELAVRLDAVERIELTAAGGERLVSLERGDTGWVVAEQDGYPASSASINALLIALAEARIVEEKTTDPAFYPRLGVADVDSAEAAGIEVAIVMPGNERHAVVLGDAYGGGQRYARRSDDARSVLIDRNPDVAREAGDWVVPDLIDVDPNRVQRVEISHADGDSLVIRKSSASETDFSVDAIPEDRELQYEGIANVTGTALQALTLEAVQTDATVTGPELSVTEYFTFDGLVVTVAASENSDGDTWLAFSARYDSAQAAAFAPESGDATGSDDDAANVMAEAEEINARLSGWRYRIPAYKLSQITRRMDDLLRAPVAADE